MALRYPAPLGAFQGLPCLTCTQHLWLFSALAPEEGLEGRGLGTEGTHLRSWSLLPVAGHDPREVKPTWISIIISSTKDELREDLGRFLGLNAVTLSHHFKAGTHGRAEGLLCCRAYCRGGR